MRPLRATIQQMDQEEERLQEIRTEKLRQTRTHALAAGAATLVSGLSAACSPRFFLANRSRAAWRRCG